MKELRESLPPDFGVDPPISCGLSADGRTASFRFAQNFIRRNKKKPSDWLERASFKLLRRISNGKI
jgi:hypothetical protein